MWSCKNLTAFRHAILETTFKLIDLIMLFCTVHFDIPMDWIAAITASRWTQCLVRSVFVKAIEKAVLVNSKRVVLNERNDC